MCGIAGEISWENLVSAEPVINICEKLKHRGPDDYNLIKLNNAVLGHRRLSIIDLSEKAKQPMMSSDKRYYIVYNGEIYNFKELKNELIQLGVKFYSKSDTEVVLNAYIKWGSKCLNKFNGMFAFAIWDNLKRQLFLVRDRFGKKPLYYFRTKDGGIRFASELEALCINDDTPKKISYEALNNFLAIGYILNPLTIYEGIFKLKPGHYMLLSSNKSNNIKYWDYSEAFRCKTNENERDIANKILYLVSSAVKNRLVGDVPVGAFLSGGIDSSTIVSLMKNHTEGDLHTFSVGFNEKSYNELSEANFVASSLETIHHAHICSIKNNSNLINNAIDCYDEPFADNSLVPTYFVSKIASDSVKVVLSGDGADELFAGYSTYKADFFYKFARLFPDFFKKFMIKTGSFYQNTNKKISLGYKIKQFFNGTLYDSRKAHYSWRLFFNQQERIELLGKQYRELVFDTDPFNTYKKYYSNVSDLHWLDQNLYVDGMTWLTDDILVKLDRASMANSIEARCPFLDIDLVTYAASIPTKLKMNGLNTKYILKKAVEKVVPKEILSKKKKGFNTPIGSWLKVSGEDEFKTFNKYVFDRKMGVYGTEKTERMA